MNWDDNQDWATPYNLISQLSRFLQAITHETVAEIKQGPGFSPPWSLIWKHLYHILDRQEQIPDENSEILDEFLEIEQSTNTSFQELTKQRHKQSIDSRGEEDDDEKSVSTERKQTETRLRAAPGSEGIGLVIQRLEIFSAYVQHLMKKLPIPSKPLIDLYQNIVLELKGLTDLLKDSAGKVRIAEGKLKELQVTAQQQHDKFFATEKDEPKKFQRLQTGWTKLAAILSDESVVSETRIPKPEEKNSQPSPSTKDLYQVVLKKEEHDEHQVSAAIVQSNSEQCYLRLISKISAINPPELSQKQIEPWQKQMRDFAQAMSEFSKSKDKAQAALTSSESKFILASRHDLMTQMQDSIGDHCTDFLDSYHAEMLIRNSSASPALYEPESLESDWQIYGKIFNLILDKLRSIWSVHAEQEDKWTAEMRAKLMSKESSKMSIVLSNLEKDAKALMEDISEIQKDGVITVYVRAIDTLRGFQGKLQSVHKEQKDTIKIYQDLWDVTLGGLLKNLQTYKDPVNAKDHDAGEAVRDLNKAEFEIINTLITRLLVYSKTFEKRHAEFVNSGQFHPEVEDKSWPVAYRDIAFDARNMLKDEKSDLNSLKKNFHSLIGRVYTLHENFTSSQSCKSLERKMTELDDSKLKIEEEEQNLSENYEQKLKEIEESYPKNLEEAYKKVDRYIKWGEFKKKFLGQTENQSGTLWEERSKFREDERLRADDDCKKDIALKKAVAGSEHHKKLEALRNRKKETEKTVIQKKLQLFIDCMDCYQPTICSDPLSALATLLENRGLYHKEGMADLTDNFLENLRIIVTRLGGSDQASFYIYLRKEVNSNPDTIERYKLLRKYTNQILEWQTSPWSMREENPKKLNDRGSVPSLVQRNGENLTAMNSLVSLLDEKPAEFESLYNIGI